VEIQISFPALIQVSRPQTYIKQTFMGVAHWQFPQNELCPQKCQNLGCHLEHQAAKLLLT
jgi:23S rRNA A1618 N6-methylase RlmF